MTYSMKGFSSDIESRLGKAYKGGADKKFGLNEVVTEKSENKSQISVTAKDVKDLDLKSDISTTLSRIQSTNKKTASG